MQILIRSPLLQFALFVSLKSQIKISNQNYDGSLWSCLCWLLIGLACFWLLRLPRRVVLPMDGWTSLQEAPCSLRTAALFLGRALYLPLTSPSFPKKLGVLQYNILHPNFVHDNSKYQVDGIIGWILSSLKTCDCFWKPGNTLHLQH